MKSVLITGCAGFIGSHLCEYYLEKNYQVIGFDNFCTGLKSNVDDLKKKPNFSFFKFDVCLPWEQITSHIANEVLRELECLFHFASPASPPLYQKLSIETMRVNSIGLEHALEFAQSYKARCIFASTSEVYGDPEVHPQTETYWGHVNSFGERSCYDEAKRYGEALIFSFNKRHHANHGLVRIFNTYGPRMNPNDGRVVINFLNQALHGQPLTIYGEGKQTRSFCYIDDLVLGITKYAQTNLAEPINLGNPNEFSILQLVEEIQKIFPEQRIVIEKQDLPMDDPKQRKPNIQKAMSLLSGWKPNITLNAGLLKTLAWLKSQSFIQNVL